MKPNSARLTVALLAVLAVAVVSLKLFVKEDAPAPAPSEIVSDVTPNGYASGSSAEENPVPTTWAPAPIVSPTFTVPPQPTQTAAPAVSTPKPAATAAPTPYVAPTTAPTAPPAETRAPVVATASGSFSSDTGTFLNLKVDWQTYTDASGNAKMQVDLSATSYSFNTDAMYNALELSVNGTIYTANSPAIHLTDSTRFVTTPLVSFIIDAPSGGVILKATWHYKGTYSGIDLNDIVASANLFL